jgi:hypothetical protein
MKYEVGAGALAEVRSAGNAGGAEEGTGRV